MESISRPKWWHYVLVIVLLAGVFSFSYYAVTRLLHYFAGLQNEVSAAIVAATATILISVFSLIISKYYERKRTIELELRDKKIPIYEDLVEFLFNVIFSGRQESKKMSDSEIVDFFQKITPKLIVWCSDGVVSQWTKYRLELVKMKPRDVDNKVFFESLYAMRQKS